MTDDLPRNGGVSQPRLETGADAARVLALDPKLWAALSCPTEQLELDARTVALLDVDNDGRIRFPEVRDAVAWTCAMLRDPRWLQPSSRGLPLEAINGASDEGRVLLAQARALCADGQDAITTTQVDAAIADLAKARINGDGVVTPSSCEGSTRRTIDDIIATHAGVKSASDEQGIDRSQLDAFFAAIGTYRAWWERRERDESLMPFRNKTEAAVRALLAVREKIEDYFVRCALVAMDPDARLNVPAKDYEALGDALLAASGKVLGLPLSRVESKRPLPLREGLNPAWSAMIADFREACLLPAGIDVDALSFGDWQKLNQQLAPHLKYLSEKPKSPIDVLGDERLLELSSVQFKQSVVALFDEESRASNTSKTVKLLAKLVYFQRDLLRFLNNFVSFGEFYSKGDAIFQAGTLYLDGRACELCLKVSDVGKHAVLAVHSMIYVIYCDCVRKSDNAKLTIAAAMTNGSSDFIMPGRNGVFVDRKGHDWDASVIRIIEQPISVREAFWSPYKRLARFIAAQVEKFAGARDRANPLPAGAAPLPTAAAPAPVHSPAFDVGKFAGIFAAIGLAIGAIGTAFATIVSGFLGLQAWQMPLAVGGGLLLISGPAVLLSVMKLRQRNLGPLLDASGWAVNSRARISTPFGKSLTRLPPFPVRRSVWPVYLFLMILIGGLLVFFVRARVAEQLPWLHPAPTQPTVLPPKS